MLLLEEIAYINGWITKEQLFESGEKLSKTGYGQYLLKVANGEILNIRLKEV